MPLGWLREPGLPPTCPETLSMSPPSRILTPAGPSAGWGSRIPMEEPYTPTMPISKLPSRQPETHTDISTSGASQKLAPPAQGEGSQGTGLSGGYSWIGTLPSHLITTAHYDSSSRPSSVEQKKSEPAKSSLSTRRSRPSRSMRKPSTTDRGEHEGDEKTQKGWAPPPLQGTSSSPRDLSPLSESHPPMETPGPDQEAQSPEAKPRGGEEGLPLQTYSTPAEQTPSHLTLTQYLTPMGSGYPTMPTSPTSPSDDSWEVGSPTSSSFRSSTETSASIARNWREQEQRAEQGTMEFHPYQSSESPRATRDPVTPGDSPSTL
ncbi:uncharacterized protein BT62DRAFT_922680 [Guyanagaster necrorhizus]|uniref:Uncharacterized protein n=1 Tax=Guyanagaster necrorhizus TaxID=856835 RepID=A0A9P7VJZ9_9AGAR|nr:uncharacterized protein BT62DRAFT_922680 [Guyanagaster necrorhizus MCA 3950]KAG7442531.1 hypothetical protein BT62DRAFT_922680 [Guyanagaster necrorhizus MCA 3950]